MHVATLGPGFGLWKMARVVASREGDFRRLATTTANLALGSFIFNTYLPPVFFGLPAGSFYYIGVFGVGIVSRFQEELNGAIAILSQKATKLWASRYGRLVVILGPKR